MVFAMRYGFIVGVKYPNRHMAQHDFYTAQELADKLRVNIMTTYCYIKAGKLKAHKIGKEFRIEEEEFEKFLSATLTK